MESDSKIIVEFELVALCNELLKKYFLWEKEEDSERSLFARAQVAICQKIMEYWIDSKDVTEADLIEASEESLKMQYSMYDEANVKNDREWRIITLARIRTITTLLRRLKNPGRRNFFSDLERPPVMQ